MGWAIGYDEHWQRDFGYGVPAICDHPKCNTKIDRGLSRRCGDLHEDENGGCGLFFCSDHLYFTEKKYKVCRRCAKDKKPYTPKPDTEEWTNFKLTDPSWAAWRKENGKT